MPTDAQRKAAQDACNDIPALRMKQQDLIRALERWRSREELNQDDLAGFEFVDARNSARELKRQLDAIMEKLGGW